MNPAAEAPMSPAEPSAPAPGSRWRHVKTGGGYEVLWGQALIEASRTPAVVYRAEVGGQVWVRPLAEFTDGRFQPLG